jgi:hypothetical protein
MRWWLNHGVAVYSSQQVSGICYFNRLKRYRIKTGRNMKSSSERDQYPSLEPQRGNNREVA